MTVWIDLFGLHLEMSSCKREKKKVRFQQAMKKRKKEEDLPQRNEEEEEEMAGPNEDFERRRFLYIDAFGVSGRTAVNQHESNISVKDGHVGKGEHKPKALSIGLHWQAPVRDIGGHRVRVLRSVSNGVFHGSHGRKEQRKKE